MTSFAPIKTLDYAWKIVAGTITIPSTSVGGGSPIISGSKDYHIGIRSGTASAVAGIYTCSLGDSGSIASVPNHKYDLVVGHFFDVKPTVSGSSFSPPIERIRFLNANHIATSGTFTFETTYVTASATAGTMTEAVARPARDIDVNVMLILKGRR